jgi:hypothetical protein
MIWALGFVLACAGFWALIGLCKLTENWGRREREAKLQRYWNACERRGWSSE